MDWLTRRASNGADGKGLWRLLWLAVVTLRQALANGLYLAVEARGAAFYQRHICGDAHLVDMATSIEVVERVEDNGKGLKPVDVELRVLDIGVVCFNRDTGIELAGCLSCDLVLSASEDHPK